MDRIRLFIRCIEPAYYSTYSQPMPLGILNYLGLNLHLREWDVRNTKRMV
nr:MAG TPA: hypothetical protein [Caudoviricetes sp.]